MALEVIKKKGYGESLLEVDILKDVFSFGIMCSKTILKRRLIDSAFSFF